MLSLQQQDLSLSLTTQSQILNQPMLNSFPESEVIQQLLNVFQQDQHLAQKWQLWMEQFSSFIQIPEIQKMLFNKNKQLISYLLEPTATEEQWNQQEAVKFLYSIIQDVFKVQDDPELRYLACKHGLLTKILERLGILAKEKPRKYVEDIQEEEKIEQGNQGQTSKIEVDKSKPRKGVGYASDNLGQNQRWDVDTYFKSKKQKNEQISTLITILTNFISSPQWTADEEMINQFCCSPLLPILEINLGSGSLLDMGKEQELYMSLLGFIKAVAIKPSLFVILEDLDSHYEPKQKASVSTLLSSANDLANIFMQCLGDQKQNSEQQQLEQLAKEIQQTFKQVQQALLEDPQEQLETDFQEILKLPLSEKYRFLLQDLRFDYMDMKKQGGGYKHHYDNMAQRNGAPPQAKMIRLAQELADLSGALPCEYTNSIFIRVDKEKVDLMKAVVMGSSGTPYAHGAFEYDIFFEDNYPNGPPKVNLETTGGGQTRFNPNLYNCGKVCLSLLGTWRGNASENWDPKLSTLLQVLMSLQSIIMSDEVYFNEPGFEGEAGTEEGEAKNEGYSNIVRYSNLRFAMIDQIRNPSKGFETVIKRHFYLKQFEILKEVNEWLEVAKTRKASYEGLVSSHNHNWASQFKGGKEIYVKFLKEAIKELEDEFAKLEVPSGKNIIRYTKKVKKQKKKVKKQVKEGENLEDIDVGSDTEEVKVSRELNVESEEVKDRWSRYIGAMGVEAVAKQSKANILISGLGGVGIEIAKNIVLAGCKKLVLHDTKLVKMKDVSSQFFLRVDQIGQNRAQASLQRIQQLNYYVKVEATTEGLEQVGFEQFQCIILTDCDSKDIENLDGLCYKNNIPLIAVDGYGVFGRIYTNFGQKFEVLDKDGDELQEFVIESISREEKCVVTLLKGSKHNLQEGDMCLLAQLQGMGHLNDSLQKCVEVINTHTFRIEFDSRVLGEYQGNGIMKQVKQKIEKKFSPFKEAMQQKMYDGNLYISDFEKIQNWDMSHVAFQALEKMIPEPWNLKQANEFAEICKEIAQQQSIQAEKQHEKFWKQFAFTCRDGSYNPLCATLGGIAAQEIVKSITQKYIPIYQLFYLDFVEVLPEIEEGQEEGIRAHLQKCENNRDYGLQVCLGQTTCENLRKVKLFMVGCGAIGCELLKNYAMLNIGSEGQIVITDPDVIEVSNLNRQFLFREKHLRKPKSSTAAAAAIAMNGSLKNHIIARIDKVHEGTKEIFTEKFFEELSVVTNALDNVQARRYIDSRCVSAKISLIDSGTLGPKGHIQVIIPNKTESYGSQQDPVEENEIPVCTLKMFPEETLHCVEWARDLFGKWFTTHPKVLNKVAEEKIPPTSQQDLQNLRIAIKKLKKRPQNFNDCIQYARKKYQKLFVNDIRQLMTVYPLDAKTKEGASFWSLPKRPPKELAFISENEYCSSFIWAYASLYAKVYGLKLPEQIRNPQEKLNIGQAALQYVQPEFIPNEEKAKQIQGEVEKQKEQAKEEEEESMSQQDASSLMNELETLLKQQALQMLPEEFEKDLDTNFHIDFIHAAANCRALNYSLQPMEWIQVKLKAGRIIPALATTTAAIAGLQTAELVKIIKGCDVGKFRNSFLNLSVPSLQCSEPGAPQKIKLNEEVVVTVWDRWEVSLGKDITLKQLLDHLEQTYKLFSRDVLYGSKPIFLKALVQNNEKQLNQKVIDLCETEEDYVDLTITFASSQEGEILSGTPIVRVQFKQKKD